MTDWDGNHQAERGELTYATDRIALAVGFRIDRKEAREDAGTLFEELSQSPRGEVMVAWKSSEGSEKEYLGHLLKVEPPGLANGLDGL